MSDGKLTLEQAAERIGMSTRYVRRLVAAGELPYHRFGRSIRFDIADLDAYSAACRVEPERDEARAVAR